MINILKKLYRLFEILKTKDIVLPPVRIISKLPKRRLPDNIFDEMKKGSGFFPFRTLFYLYDWLKFETITKIPDGRFVINSFLPPMPGKGYERMFTNLVSGRKLSPVSAYFAVTSKCNYDCWHCSYKNRPDEDLTLEQIVDTIDQLIDIGTSVIGITGGEPTLRDDLVDIVSKASVSADCMVFTNGSNFTEELASKLKEAGLWAVAVSIDSHLPEKHNEKRSNDSAFDKAIEAINISKKYGFYTMITTVPDINILKDGSYKKIYDLSVSLDIDEYRIVEPMPTGKILSCGDCLLDDSLREEIKDFHRSVNSKNLKPKVCSFALIESKDYFGCCAGTMHLFIDSAGNVCPCDFTPLSFGNIKELKLTECWQRLNDAFKLPGDKCFIQKYYTLLQEHYNGTLPLTYEDSIKIMNQVSDSELPDYFKHVMFQNLKS